MQEPGEATGGPPESQALTLECGAATTQQPTRCLWPASPERPGAWRDSLSAACGPAAPKDRAPSPVPTPCWPFCPPTDEVSLSAAPQAPSCCHTVSSTSVSLSLFLGKQGPGASQTPSLQCWSKALTGEAVGGRAPAGLAVPQEQTAGPRASLFPVHACAPCLIFSLE